MIEPVIPALVVATIAALGFWRARQIWSAREQARSAEEAALRARLETSLQLARESEERFRLVALTTRDIIWDWDLKTDSMISSPGGPELFGYPPDDWPNTSAPWMRILHPADKPRVTDTVERFLKGELPKYEFRFRGVTKDDRVLHLFTSAILLRDGGGVPSRLVGFTRDITAEVAAEESRLQTQKLEGLGLLAGGIAHDFNNILTVLSTSIELASRKNREPEVSDPLATAALAIERAALLTRQLLAYAGRTSLSQRPLDLNELVKSISTLLSVSMKPNVSMEVALANELPLVRGDDGQLQQLVMNLVTNAGEAIGDAKGVVRLHTRRQTLTEQPPGMVSPAPLGDVVVVEVQDTGAGMTPDVKARIFDPFFSTKGGGRGLGLSALAGILRVHGGAVALDSQPGAGTTFTVYFPAVQRTAETLAQVTRQPPRTRIDARVLLVDDEPMLRRSARRLLELIGCQVDEASNGREAIEKVEARPEAWDVVLMDVTMPEMSGFEAARRMKQLAPKLPVVLSSGYSEEDGELPTEITATLPKPYDVQRLTDTLLFAMESRQRSSSS